MKSSLNLSSLILLLIRFFQEYKKGESQTNIEIMKEEDFSKILEMEEAYIKKTCDDIIRYAPDLVSFRYLDCLKFWWG